jgi:uncharacterized membrane protein
VLGEKKHMFAGLIIGLIILMAKPVFAKPISFEDTGVAFWIFIIIGAIIVLLQLIPAIILFFSFVAAMTTSRKEGGSKKSSC